ncbi:MAG: N-acetylmuramoyl-L-alanine amidase, partial [Lachnospiraceae bacterium]|nr:N-acetylmuramoyl-L-alanine amidase [Lachnospiraceae bacterium]
MAYSVYLDAGHGGYDSGATDGNRKEKDDTLELTLAVGQILQDNGVDVGYTRVEDVYDSPLRKAQIANEAGADLFVSFHRNAAERRNQYNGVQTLVYNNSGLKKEMADAINQALAEVGFVNLGTEVRRDLAVLRRTQMPALLVEAGFIDSDTDNEVFDENFDDMAKAIAYAILDTLKANGLVSGNTVRTMSAVQRTSEAYPGSMRNRNAAGGQNAAGGRAGAQNGMTGDMPSSQSGMQGGMPSSQGGMTGNMPSSQSGMQGNMPTSQNGMTGNMPSSQNGMQGNMPTAQNVKTGKYGGDLRLG